MDSDNDKPKLELSGALPGAWYGHAERLRRSAEHLWGPLEHALTLEPPVVDEDLALWDHSYAFLLVAGTALEAMIKAGALAAHLNVDGFARILTEDSELEGWFTTHNLISLAKRADLSLAPDEEDQLKRFEKYVVWAGSYPTTRNLRPPTDDRFGFRVSNLDRIWFDRLYASAEERYQRHLSEAATRTQPEGGGE